MEPRPQTKSSVWWRVFSMQRPVGNQGEGGHRGGILYLLCLRHWVGTAQSRETQNGKTQKRPLLCCSLEGSRKFSLGQWEVVGPLHYPRPKHSAWAGPWAPAWCHCPWVLLSDPLCRMLRGQGTVFSSWSTVSLLFRPIFIRNISALRKRARPLQVHQAGGILQLAWSGSHQTAVLIAHLWSP